MLFGLKKQKGKIMANDRLLSDEYVKRVADRLGIPPERVVLAVRNLLYGDGAVYRRVVAVPLHGVAG